MKHVIKISTIAQRENELAKQIKNAEKAKIAENGFDPLTSGL